MNGGISLSGEWLPAGTRVVILREGYRGMCGLFNGKRPKNKLLLNLQGAAVRLHLTAAEIRRAEPAGHATGRQNTPMPNNG